MLDQPQGVWNLDRDGLRLARGDFMLLGSTLDFGFAFSSQGFSPYCNLCTILISGGCEDGVNFRLPYPVNFTSVYP